MASFPGPPAPTFGQGGPASAGDIIAPQSDLFSALPIRAINVPATAAAVRLLGEASVLVGWSLRETTGLAPLVVELIDGPDANGSVVAETFAVSPISTLGQNSDVDVDASSAAAGAANNVTLAGAAGATTFITGFEITGDGATAASIIAVTITGILGGTKTYFLTIPAGASTAITPLLVEFSRPIPASAVNTPIVVNVPSFGAGNTNAAVTAHGFQRTVNVVAGAVGGTTTQTLPGLGVLLRSGLFLRVLSGTCAGAVWVRI